MVMANISGPSGWHDGLIETRLVTTAPSSIDESTRSVSAIISQGTPVRRFYGTEILTISRDAVDTARVLSGQCPLLDSHQSSGIAHALGRVTETWITAGALWAKLQFNRTDEGDRALGMVARGELTGVSCGYRVTAWQVSDEDGRIIDQENTYWTEGDDFTYTALKWELLEVSLVSVAADAGAGVRIVDDHLTDIRARMTARQAMSDRMSLRAYNLQ
jgi:phage head maturation protease